MPPKSKRKAASQSASYTAAGVDVETVTHLPPGVSITWQLEDASKNTWVVYSTEVQDALTAAAMSGKKQVNLTDGARTALIMDLVKMVQRTSKGVEKRVRGLVESNEKLFNWEVKVGEEWGPMQVGIMAKLEQMMEISSSVVVGRYKYHLEKIYMLRDDKAQVRREKQEVKNFVKNSITGNVKVAEKQDGDEKDVPPKKVEVKAAKSLKDDPEEEPVMEKAKINNQAAIKRKAVDDEPDCEPKSKRTGPGGKVEVVFSFDTTGSMYACLSEVRRGIKQAIQRLKVEVPGIRIAIIAHGDYCDAHSSYVTKIQEFSEDEEVLCKFVENVGATGGGDADECYELVLREARTKLAWSAGSIRSLVMIGDCNPHGPNYPLNQQNINWKTECGHLKDEEIRIYAVQALNRKEATSFYRELASLTDGFHLKMDQFSSIVNFMMAICFREEGGDTLDTYETEVKTGGKGMNRELHRLFDTLQGRATSDFNGADPKARPDGLVPIDPSRFQVLHVPKKCSIKEFVQNNSLMFRTGRGFYEFTKPEIISSKKEVVLIDKATGDMVTGQEAFDMIGAGDAKKIRPTAFESWRVFVQSTSYNRALVGGTGFLYEVDVDH